MASNRVRGGRLRQNVTIQQATITRNAEGQPIPSWSTYITRRAHVMPDAGSEREEADEIRHQMKAKIILRSDSQTRAITNEMRVLYGTRVLEIMHAYDDMERRKQVILACKERT